MISTNKIIKGIEKELIEIDKEFKVLKEEERVLEIKIGENVRLYEICSKIKNDLLSANTNSTG